MLQPTATCRRSCTLAAMRETTDTSGGTNGRRVAFVSEHLHGAGGLELFELAIAEGLAARGWQVAVSFLRPGDLVDRWARCAEMWPAEGKVSSDDVVAGADVGYAHSPPMFRPLLDAAQRSGRPAVAHLHLPPFHLRGGWKGLVRGRVRYPMDETVYSKRTQFDAFAAVSAFTRKQWVLSGLPAAKVRVIHNGVDPAMHRPPSEHERAAVRAELGLADDDVVIGYVGRIDLQKGIEELIDAFSDVSRDVAGARLVIAGEPTIGAGADGVRLVERLQAKSPDTVSWLGRRTDAARLFHAFDIFVMPSRWDEPFGLVVIEAMASGVPVIAGRRGGIPEILSGELDRCLIEPDRAGIAAALRSLIGADRSAIVRRGIEIVDQRFTVARTAEAVERMFVDVIRDHRTP